MKVSRFLIGWFVLAARLVSSDHVLNVSACGGVVKNLIKQDAGSSSVKKHRWQLTSHDCKGLGLRMHVEQLNW